MRQFLLGVALVVVAACEFRKQGSTNPGDPDAPPIDSPNVPPDGCVTFSDQLDTCALGPAVDVVVMGNRVYNTDTFVLEDVGGGNPQSVKHVLLVQNTDMIDLIVANNFTLALGSTLRVVGTRPFGIVAFQTVTIHGTLDATGSAAIPGAAGARDQATCSTRAGQNASNNNGGAPGAGGGSFRGVGGNGGQGDANGNPTAGSNGGVSEGMPTGFPRGGCPGGDGGNSTGNTRGARGHGGGAVDLIAAVGIIVTGTINAGGSGGIGGLQIDGGAGGGGSGGMIVLEAPSIGGAGGVAANGGGGGGGGGNTPSGVGTTGGIETARTSGGTRADSGSSGGDGGAASDIAGETVTTTSNNGGGGGGGGGAGYIRVLRDTTPTFTVLSPAPSS